MYQEKQSLSTHSFMGRLELLDLLTPSWGIWNGDLWRRSGSLIHHVNLTDGLGLRDVDHQVERM